MLLEALAAGSWLPGVCWPADPQRRRSLPAGCAAGAPTSNGNQGSAHHFTTGTDIFAFGLIILELATKRKLEASNCEQWPQLLEALQDAECQALIRRCCPVSLTCSKELCRSFPPGLCQSRH